MAYWLRKGDGPWKKVTAEEFADTEADAGFHGRKPATFGFSAIGPDDEEVEGEVTFGDKPPET